MCRSVTRAPSEASLTISIDYSIRQLERIKIDLSELVRRRQHDAGRDGYPSTSMGGGSSGGTTSSSTETAALGRPIQDPLAGYIDQIFDLVRKVDEQMTLAGNCLANVRSTEAQMRGRQSTLEDCDCCNRPITGVGDDRRRSGFCPACYKAFRNWRTTALDSTARPTFVAERRKKIAEKASAG